MKNTYDIDKHGLYLLCRNDIEDEMMNLLEEYNPELLEIPQKLDTEDFIENFLGLNLEFHTLSKDHNIYGAFVFNDGKIKIYDDGEEKEILVTRKTVIIDSAIEDISEKVIRFTEGHEPAHYILQYDLMSSSEHHIHSDKFENHGEVIAYYAKSSNTRKRLVTKEDWMEWQANYGSACLLMNRSAVLVLLSNLFSIDKESLAEYCSHLSIFDYLKAKFAISRSFDVTERSAGYRLDAIIDYLVTGK